MNKISEIIAAYDSFVIDLWGVIHDGQNLYPNVLQTMQELKKQNKKVVFLSNAPRRAQKVKEVLAKFGITPDYYIDAVSSGEVAFQEIGKLQAAKNYFYIGPQKDADLLDGLELVETAADKADFAITTGFDADNSTLEEKLPQIEAALAAGLKLYCANPDLIVVRQDGTKMLCAGVIGNYYKEQGGQVEFVGKPHRAVYDYVLPMLTGKIIAIGDAPETDIKGANNAGIDSALVLGGILKASTAPLAQVLKDHGANPTYVIESFGY